MYPRDIRDDIFQRVRRPYSIENHERPCPPLIRVDDEEQAPDGIAQVIAQHVLRPDVALIEQKSQQNQHHADDAQKQEGVDVHCEGGEMGALYDLFFLLGTLTYF